MRRKQQFFLQLLDPKISTADIDHRSFPDADQEPPTTHGSQAVTHWGES